MYRTSLASLFRPPLANQFRFVQQHSSSRQMPDIQNVAVIGSGLMGAGIAQVSACSGFKVTMVDQSDQILNKSKNRIEESLKRVSKKKFPNDSRGAEAFVKDTINKLSCTTDMSKGVGNADIVIEAVVENVELKRDLFSNECILATNTSSLCLSDISTVLRRKENFGGLHFFNPVPVMELLEVVRLPETSDQTFKTLTEFGQKLGKKTVSSKDTPGFIVNRLLVPYMMEAVRMAERGDATPRDIDTAMRAGAGYPMGPFELADYVGLDVTKFIIDGWTKKYPDNLMFQPSPWLDKLVAEGKLGRKSGEGFYKY